MIEQIPRIFYKRNMKPIYLIFNATNRCNSFCSTCFAWNYLNKSPDKELKIDEISKISDSLGKIEWLLVTGGEPFLRQDLEEVIKNSKIKLIYTSTSYIFSGKNAPYNEGAIPDPVNFYGKIKVNAEKIIISNIDNYLILRLSKLYGYNGKDDKITFITKVLNKLKENKEIQLDNTIKKYLLLIDDVAVVIDGLLKRDCKGIYNVSVDKATTDYKWGLKIANVFGLPSNLIGKKGSVGGADRPLDTELNLNKINGLGIRTTSLKEGVDVVKKKMLK